MRLKNLLMAGLLIVCTACANYKTLEPKPEITAREADYTAVLDKDKNFKVKDGKKYKMEFPALAQENTYLVIQHNQRQGIDSYLTRQFDDDGNMLRMEDVASDYPDREVYQLDLTVPTFFWVVDHVDAETELDIDYRYMPIWRYRIETRSAALNETLRSNTIDRTDYNALGVNLTADAMSVSGNLSDVRNRIDNLQAVQGELLEIEAIFPDNIRNSTDAAYLSYSTLSSDLKKEIAFQQQYETLLDVLDKEKKSRGNTRQFATAIPDFLNFFEQKNVYPQAAVSEVQRLVGGRLGEIAPYFEQTLRSKNDINPIELPADQVDDLYRASGRVNDRGFNDVANFIDQFNRDVASLNNAKETIKAIDAEIRSSGSWPSNSFYAGVNRRISQVENSLPRRVSYGRYSNYSCARKLGDEINRVRRSASSARTRYSRAADVVSQINSYRTQNDYPAIRRLLKNNTDLGFLITQYKELDRESLRQQGSEINRLLEGGDWANAERKISELYRDRDFLDYAAISREKDTQVKQYEEKLVQAIEQASKDRINAFIDANQGNFENVDALYANEAFDPVHTLSFSSGGPNVVDSFNKRIRDYLNGFKHDQFPKTSIEKIYRFFTSNPRDRGVEKARGIVAHGKQYKGKDRRIKNLVAECNPLTAKWITKPKNYRKMYALPVNKGQGKANEYVFRINLRIPSDAKFPVYDVNIKLPREVADKAGSQQWYTKMTMNGKILKNEGRFTITAPTKFNNYECQITPLQVKKTGNNILEVRFNHDAFKVLEVSVMAQRPIMKRN